MGCDLRHAKSGFKVGEAKFRTRSAARKYLAAKHIHMSKMEKA